MHQNRLKIIVFMMMLLVMSCEQKQEHKIIAKFKPVGTDSILVHSKAYYSNDTLKVDYVFENKSELDTFYFLLSNWEYTKYEIENQKAFTHKTHPCKKYIINYLKVYPSKYEAYSFMAHTPASPFYKKMPFLLQIEPSLKKKITVEIIIKISEILDNWKVYTQFCFTNNQNIAQLMNILSDIDLAKITRKDKYIYINFNKLKEDDCFFDEYKFYPPWRIWKMSKYKITNIEEAIAIINCFYLNKINATTNIDFR